MEEKLLQIKNEETNDEQPVVNELKDEIIPEEKVEKISKKIEEKPVEKVLPKSVENAPLKTSNNLNEIYLNKLRDVRINNCFVGAQKTLKEKYIDIWKNYLLHENDRKIKGLLSDTEVVMASKDIIVLMHPYDDNAMQINNNIESVEKVFNSFNNSNYKLVTVSISGWKNATQKYMEDKANNIKYETQEEPQKEETIELNDIFLNDKIVVI